MAYKSVSANAKTYYSGMGYALGLKKRRVSFKTSKSREIFRKGYSAGLSRVKNRPHKYPKI